MKGSAWVLATLPPTVLAEHPYVLREEATLDFIDKRGRRMAEWLRDNHPEIEVRE